MILRALSCSLLLATASCADIPRDQAGTLERIRATDRFHVGVIASGEQTPPTPLPERFLRAVSARTGARPVVESGSMERLMTQLEEGKLDLVIGEIGKQSPWRKRVSILPPITPTRSEANAPLQLVAAARNGENAWIGLLYREVKQLPGTAS